MGRPLKEIDGDEVYKLAKIGCTQVDIAEFFGCDEKTIRNRFSDEFRQGKEQGKISLRRYQWKRARAGSDQMLIHLGKSYLGQTDRVDVTTKQTILMNANGGDTELDGWAVQRSTALHEAGDCSAESGGHGGPDQQGPLEMGEAPQPPE